MAGEFKRWVEAQTDLTPEEKAKMLEAFNTDKLSKAMDNGVMMQDRFNRSMDDLRRQQTELTNKAAKLQQDWETANAEYIRMQEDMGSTQAELAAAKKAADDAKTELDKATKIDPAKVITADQLTELRRQDAAAIFQFNTEMALVQQQHKQLFGEDLNPMELYKATIESEKRSPIAYWEEKYKVPEKRAEIAKAAHDKEIAEAVEKGKQEAIAQMSNPATRSMRPSTSPFFTPEGEVKEGDTARPKSGPWDEEGEFAAETQLRTELEKAAFGIA